MATLFVKHIVPKAPMLLATTVSHYTYGPPKPSWTLKFHLTMAFMQSMVGNLNTLGIKRAQAASRVSEEFGPVHPTANAWPDVVPDQFRLEASDRLDRLFKDQGLTDARLAFDWKNDPRLAKPLKAEWTEPKEKDEKFSKERTILYLHGGGFFLCNINSHRWATGNMARLGGAKVFAIDYRLAPDSPFPAALHDAISAYMYLLNPPSGAGFEPIDPKNIVIMGDSAGGNLTFATMLAIRDLGLPMCAGIIGWSPWLDLLHSFPSVSDNSPTDYLPADGFSGDSSLRALGRKVSTVDEVDLLRDESIPSIQIYANNSVLDSKYVSPVLEDDLSGTCPILIIAGDGEMLRDESIVFATRHSDGPTSIQLSVYDDMPHVFQMFGGAVAPAKVAMQESGDFVRNVTVGGKGSTPGKTLERVSVQGERRPMEQNVVHQWETRLGKVGGGSEYLAKL